MEKPLTLVGGPVLLPDGKEFGTDSLGTAGYFIYRQRVPGAIEEIWDAEAKLWKSTSGDLTGIKSQPYIPKMEEIDPWQAIIVAAGQQDGLGLPVFSKASAGYPRYTFRSFFAPKTLPDGTSVAALSGPSNPVQFLSTQDAQQAGIALPDGQKPENADQITLFLRVGTTDLAWVDLKRSGGGAQVEIGNSSGALIRILPGGDIEIQPASGGGIFFGAPVQAETVFYQPADAAGNPAGGKRWLA
jgi:hypothetical protein